MKKKYYLAILIFLVISSTALTAFAATAEMWSTSRDHTSDGNAYGKETSQVTLTLYVLDGGINGPLLPGVVVTGQDAKGNSFEGVTDSNGAVVIKGPPGTWQFTFAKEGYKTFSGNYDVTRTHSAATYLQRAAQPQEQVTTQPQEQVTQPQEQTTQPQEQVTQQQEQVAQPQEQVALTVHVYEGDFNGSLLSDVQVTGRDAGGNSFEGITDLNGTTVLNGQPGTWQFTFAKEGYDTLDLNYTVTENDNGKVYLRKTVQPQEQVARSQRQITQSQEPVALTVYVHGEDLNGTLLAGVGVAGQDAEGNSFEGVTDSNGAVVLSGQPGTWQFTFSKEGYDTLSLSYTVNESEEAAVYLQKPA